MTFYAATLGQLIIVELFVFFIWLRVLFWTIRDERESPRYLKLLTTSIGLVVSSLAVFGIITTRAAELIKQTEYMPSIMIFFIMLAIGNFMFLVSASIGNGWRQVQIFLAVSGVWTAFYILSNI